MPEIISREEYVNRRLDGILKRSISDSAKKVRDFLVSPHYHEIELRSNSSEVKSHTDGKTPTLLIPGILLPADLSPDDVKTILKSNRNYKSKLISVRKDGSCFHIQVVSK